MRRFLLPFNLPPKAKKYQFQGSYQRGYQGGPERPFVRALVTLRRFKVSKQVDMWIDSGSDVTTLQPRDSLLMLEEAQFKQMDISRNIQTVGGYVKSYNEEAAIGFMLDDKRICWIPIVIDIIDPNSRSNLPSTLGNDILQFGTVALNAVRGIIRIELLLSNPLITSS